MNPRPGNRIRVLLLALLLALGMSLSFVQGGLMAAGMAVSADGAHHEGGCDGCGGGDDGGADTDMCLAVCGSASHGLLAGEPLALAPASRTDFQTLYLVIDGRSNSPDHGPPKILTLG